MSLTSSTGKTCRQSNTEKCAAPVLGTSDEEDEENWDSNSLAQGLRWVSDGQ